MGICEILLIIFIVLKVIGEIAWPWPVVLIPLWIALGIYGIWFLIWATAVWRLSHKWF